MKKIAFILYVGCVLAFSAFARAEVMMPFSKSAKFAAPVTIESVTFDQTHFELVIDGFLPNPCTEMPSATLVQDIENPNVLIVRLSSPLHTEVCVSRTKDFSKTVSLPVLAQNSQIALQPGAVYAVRTDGNSFELQVRGEELMRVPGFVAY